jgi:uncharacterized membrane protein
VLHCFNGESVSRCGIVFLTIGLILFLIGYNVMGTLNGIISTTPGQIAVYQNESAYEQAYTNATLLEIVGLGLTVPGAILTAVGVGTTPAKEISKVAIIEGGAHDDAIKQLDDKLLKGEITKKEYRKMKKTLLK